MPSIQLSPEQIQTIAENTVDCETVELVDLENGNIKAIFIEGEEKRELIVDDEGNYF